MKVIGFFRQWRRRLSGKGSLPALRKGVFIDQTAAFFRVQMLLRALYVYMAFLGINAVTEWSAFLAKAEIAPLWPVAWLHSVSLSTGILCILILFTVGPLLAAAFPQFLASRLLAFFSLFEYWALNNSFGKIGHSLHALLLISFFLLFLPKGWTGRATSRSLRQRTLVVFWSVQGVILLVYSMAGLIKILLGIYQLSAGQPNVFCFEALSRLIADRLLQTGVQSSLGSFLILHPWAGYPLMLLTLYLELFAFWSLFRPRLGLSFAFGLVAFHVSSYFTMTILFPENCFLLLLLVAPMPLLRGPWCWRRYLADWPLLGRFLSLLLNRFPSLNR